MKVDHIDLQTVIKFVTNIFTNVKGKNNSENDAFDVNIKNTPQPNNAIWKHQSLHQITFMIIFESNKINILSYCQSTSIFDVYKDYLIAKYAYRNRNGE